MSELASEKSCCAVCLEDLRADLVALRCGHVFHQPCASAALALSSKCPICRKKTLAKKFVRLFYSAGGEAAAESSSRPVASGTQAPPPPVPATPARNATTTETETLSDRFSELQLSVNRLTLNQRRISSHSFRLQAENTRLRQENERAAEQLDAARIKQEELVKELGVWKRISTGTYAQLQTLVQETSEANRSLLAFMKELTRELLALSSCASCEGVAQASSVQLKNFCQQVESKAKSAAGARASPQRKAMACCATEGASRALRGFCARHHSCAPASVLQQQQQQQAE